MYVLFYTTKIINQRIGKKLSKIKEKKLNSIKSEMQEIKKYVTSNNYLDSSDEKTDYLNNNEDTVILTQIVQDGEKINNNNDLYEIKKELKLLKETININTSLLNEILLKFK